MGKEREEEGDVQAARRLLEELAASTAIMPIEEMESLIAQQEGVVDGLKASLRREAGAVEFLDHMNLLVLAGEVRSPALVPEIIDHLTSPEANPDEALVAMEALAKTGEAAVPALAGLLAHEVEPLARLYAYGALGYIDCEEAVEILLKALSTEEEILDVVGQALAQHRRPGTLESLYEAYERAPDYLNPALEGSLRQLAGVEEVPAPLWSRNWRVRYRRRPALGWGIDPSWESMAARLHTDPEIMQRMAGEAPVKRSLEEIIAPDDEIEPTFVEVGPEGNVPQGYCPRCGRRIELIAGIGICPTLARLSITLQRGMLLRWREEEKDSLSRELDRLDVAQAAYLEKVGRLEEAGVSDPEREQIAQSLGRISFAQDTALFLIEEGYGTTQEGLSHLSRLEKRAPAASKEELAQHGFRE